MWKLKQFWNKTSLRISCNHFKISFTFISLLLQSGRKKQHLLTGSVVKIEYFNQSFSVIPNENLTYERAFRADTIAPGQKPCKHPAGGVLDVHEDTKNAETVQLWNPLAGWSSNLSKSSKVGVNDIASFAQLIVVFKVNKSRNFAKTCPLIVHSLIFLILLNFIIFIDSRTISERCKRKSSISLCFWI